MTETMNMELVWGGDAIAKVIGRTSRVTFKLLESGQLPAKKVGNRWVAERSKLITFFTDTTTAVKERAA